MKRHQIQLDPTSECVKGVLASIALAGEIQPAQLYAMVLGHITLKEANAGLRCLTKTGLVKRRKKAIKWIGKVGI